MKHKQVGSSLIVIALLMQAFVVGMTFAQSSLSTIYISGGIYPGGPSYTVWTDAITIFAKDANGQIDFTSTNASDVIVDCSNALTSGGLIYVKSGTYTIDRGSLRPAEVFYTGCQITQDNITIMGEGPSTIFVPAQSMQRIFSFYGATHCSLVNLCVDGQYIETQHWPDAADAQIAFDEGSHYGLVENVISKRGNNSDGIGAFLCNYVTFRNNEVWGCEHGIVLTTNIGSKIQGNHVYLCTGDGTLIYGSGYLWTEHNEIIDNIINNCSINGIELSGNASYCTVARNRVEFCNKSLHVVTFHNIITDNTFKGSTYENLAVGYPTYNTATNNVISNNQILSASDASNGWGIYEWSGSDYNTYVNNQCFYNEVGGIFMETAAASSNSRIIGCYNSTTWIATWGTG